MSFKIKQVFVMIVLFISLSVANNVELLKNIKLEEGKITYNGIPANKINLFYNAGAATVKNPTKIAVEGDVLVIQTSETTYHIQIKNINLITVGSNVIKIMF